MGPILLKVPARFIQECFPMERFMGKVALYQQMDSFKRKFIPMELVVERSLKI